MEMYDENGNRQNEEKPRKRHAWIWVLSCFGAAVLTAVSVFGAAFLANRVIKRSDDTTPTLAVEEQQPSGPSRETPGETSKDPSKEPSKAPSEAADDKDGGKAVLTVSESVKTSDKGASVTVLDVSDIVDAVMPTVVAVTDTLEYTSIQNSNPYSYFFGQGGGNSYEGVASGSGVIISATDKELLIVTNNHVVDNTSSAGTGYSVSSKGLTITFCDGSTAEATVKGTDPDNDLAVISVNLSDLKEETLKAIRIAVVGSSDDLKVGDGVIAIGNAGGYGQSVTTGIISAKDRKVTIDGTTFTLLQTDAAINPGNSGGGLFNASGELIGINNSKTVSTDIEGMGFAIPISSAQGIIEDLMNIKTVADEDKGYLGITMSTVPSQYVSQGYPAGVLVSEVMKGSPAEKAGLQPQDIITAVDGRTVKTGESLRALLDSYEAGTTVKLTVQRFSSRSYKEMEIEVTLSRYKDIDFSSAEETTPEETEKEDYDLDDILKEFFGD